jgi:hypothetical protein
VGVHAADARVAEMPSEEEFAASESAFEVAGFANILNTAAHTPTDDETCLCYFFSGARGTGAGWQLDQGDGEGQQWYHDNVHVVRVMGDVVVATGHNAFAPFVSAGVGGLPRRSGTSSER